MKQQSLASQGVFEKYGRKSRRELFLEEMERVVPWSALESLVRPHYAKAGNGRQPVGLVGINHVNRDSGSDWTHP
jgi:IS5 family transposase